MIFFFSALGVLAALAFQKWLVASLIVLGVVLWELFQTRDDRMALERKRRVHMHEVNQAIVDCLVEIAAAQNKHGMRLLLRHPSPAPSDPWSPQTARYSITKHTDPEAVAVSVTVQWSIDNGDTMLVTLPGMPGFDPPMHISYGLASLATKAEKAVREFVLSRHVA